MKKRLFRTMQILSLFLDSCLATEAHTGSTRMGMPCQFYGTSSKVMPINTGVVFFFQPNAMLPCTFPGFFALSHLAFRCAISSRARDIAELGFTSHCDLAHQMHHWTQGTGGTGGTGRWYRTKFSETLSNLSTSSLEARRAGDRRQRVEVI